ncbi:hypothetical protein JOM56_004655 [Amanita muscaria]
MQAFFTTTANPFKAIDRRKKIGSHVGAYDDLTLWEQIDDGAQHTPATKRLFSVPIVLFLASTHYQL